MIDGGKGATSRQVRRARWLGASILAGIAATTSPALAECAPEPTLPDTTTVCTGIDANGLTVSTDGTVINVAQGAIVSARPDGAGAIVLQATSGRLFSSLDNRGSVTSSTGPAITTSGNPGFQGFLSIVNQSGATISGTTGGINVVVERLTNAGTVDGGSGSAYSFSAGDSVLYPATLFNTGQMLSNGNAATIAFSSVAPQQFRNGGRIVNSGAGLAIDAGRTQLILVNEGVIGTAGAIALRSTFQAQIVNFGTINGSVIGGSGFADRIDTSIGSINGDLLLNGGDDLLIARLGAARLVDNVSGTVDGGAGIDTLNLIVTEDRLLADPVLPSGFERLQLTVGGGTLTLAGNAVPVGGYSVHGTGMVKTGSDMAAAGPLLTGQIIQQNPGFEALNFANDYVLSATLASPELAAVRLNNLDSATNTGVIRAIGGNGAVFDLNQDGLATNIGLIEASDTALNVSGQVDNRGMIRSTDGIGLVNNLGGGTIRRFGSVNSGTIAGYTKGVQLAATVLINTGAISAINGIGVDLSFNSMIDNRIGGTISGAVAGVTGTDNASVLNAGTINGDVDFGEAADWSSVFVDQGGIVNGNVIMGGGDDFYIADLSRGFGGVTGAVDPGSGADTVIFRVDADANVTLVTIPGFEIQGYELEDGASLILTAETPFEGVLGLSGTGDVDLSADIIGRNGRALDLAHTPAALLIASGVAQGSLNVVSRGTLTLETSEYSLPLAAVNAARPVGDSRVIHFENAGTINVLGPADRSFMPTAVAGATGVINAGTIRLSSATGVADSLSLVNSGAIVQTVSEDASVGVQNVGTITNSGVIRVGGVAVQVDPSGLISNNFVLENSGVIESLFDTAVRVSYDAVGNIHNSVEGLIKGSDVAITLQSGGEIINEGVIIGTVMLGSAFGPIGGRIVNLGSIEGNIWFGDANDIFIQRSAMMPVLVDGGSGLDILELAGGSAAQPVTLARASNFERLLVSSGYAVLPGSHAFNQIDVTSGRLVGRAGSILSGAVAVGNGGTFGSAGTVIGNISVASGGTLSPGASPGTMTVTGNVALASGSTTLLEFTPTVSDKLVISGTLAIAGGATLAMVGERPLTPGVTLDLIVADGGITGSFGTVNKASAVLGFLRQTSNKLQLLGQFVTPAGTSPQVAGAIGYVNGTLVAGQGSTALLAAIPTLLNSDGTTRIAAFAQLTPEAYATASQLGIDQGLSIARTARGGATGTTREEAGPYSFVRGIGDWRRLQGNGAAGVSPASSHSYGMLGGIGFGSERASLGAFVGYADSTQRIAALGSRTSANGVFAGVAGHVEAGGFDLTALAAYDWSNASTRRAVPGATVRSSNYGLRNLVLDMTAGYDLSVGDGWAVRPELGATHVSTRRGAASENGSGAFALAIDADRLTATFVDGAVSLRGGQGSGATFRPWVQAGVRHQIGGETAAAHAGFVGTTTGFDALGAARKRTMATAGIGFGADIAPGMGLFASYLGEFGGGRSSNADIGLRLTF